jgi:hypothetical protein
MGTNSGVGVFNNSTELHRIVTTLVGNKPAD